MELDEQININLETANRFRSDALVMSEAGVRMIADRMVLENKALRESLTGSIEMLESLSDLLSTGAVGKVAVFRKALTNK